MSDEALAEQVLSRLNAALEHLKQERDQLRAERDQLKHERDAFKQINSVLEHNVTMALDQRDVLLKACKLISDAPYGVALGDLELLRTAIALATGTSASAPGSEPE